MNLPGIGTSGPLTPGSNIRNIGANQSPGVVNSVQAQQGQALLVYNTAPGSGSGSGSSQYGTQLLTSAANAQRIALGSMIVAESSDISGAVSSSANVPGMLLIEDKNNNIVASVPVPSGNIPQVFNSKLYPLLAQIGSVTDQKNNALGNYTNLGAVPQGWAWIGSDGSLLGWTPSGSRWDINPAKFPFSLIQLYVASTDNLVGIMFRQTGTVYPGASGDGSQSNVILFDPDGIPVLASSIRTDLGGLTAGGFWNAGMRTYLPKSTLKPGWWVIVDNGLGNDVLETYNPYNFGGQGIAPVLGGGVGYNWNILGLGAAAGVEQVSYDGVNYGMYPFGQNSRIQYQLVTQLYRQNINQINLVMLYDSVPASGTVTVSATT